MKDWQIKAIQLYEKGHHAGEISMLLMVDYHTAYGFLRKYADYKPPQHDPHEPREYNDAEGVVTMRDLA